MKYVKRKAMIIRESGRSSDYISPSFGFGCMYKCNYCYMRRHVPNGLTVANNPGNILDAIYDHAFMLGPKEPNQTHNKFWTYDISCNEDFILHAKYHNWKLIFDFFKMCGLPVFATMATKYVNASLLDYNPIDEEGNKRIRIRFSIMPQHLSDQLEPNTSLIEDRINAVNAFYEAGYDVHINYSPIIHYEGWLDDYKHLFNMVNDIIDDNIKHTVLAECIFVTHNHKMHQYNVENNTKGEEYLWQPGKQETKMSQYGNENIRYNRFYKSKYINQFKELHNSVIPWNTIRYIF